ncbi:hypothetical protein [Actinopolymorpha pittospori]
MPRHMPQPMGPDLPTSPDSTGRVTGRGTGVILPARRRRAPPYTAAGVRGDRQQRAPRTRCTSGSRQLGGQSFEYLLGRFTEPSEVLGPVDLLGSTAI